MQQPEIILAQPADSAQCDALLQAVPGLHPLVGSLLVQRGFSSYSSIRDLFNPSENQLHDPLLMRFMERAANRLHKALQQGERVLVYGDYDADGTTAVALVYNFLSRYTGNLSFYIPDRHKEGYGLSEAGVLHAHSTGCTVIVALDCGIKAIDRARQCRELGIDLIVCDHHLPGDELPETYATLNPKQPGCAYPFKELCGCAVGFKLLQGLCALHPGSYDMGLLMEQVDLVAVATAADLVPMTGENRVLCALGLQRLNRQPRKGLQALLTNSGTQTPEAEDLVFRVGPRINAAGRIRSGMDAVRLLTEESTDLCDSMSRELEQLNATRRALDKQITEEALVQLAGHRTQFTSVVSHHEWHRGVIGIVASRLIERHYRPTVVLTRSGDNFTGSARSIEGFDLYAALEKCAHLLAQFGGHSHAAGLTLPAENVELFREAFEEACGQNLSEYLLTPKLHCDMEVDFNSFYLSHELGQWRSRAPLLPKFYLQMQRMGPFGPQYMQPVFITHNVVDTGKSRVLKGEHLKLEVCQQGRLYDVMEGIAFGMGDLYDRVATGEPFTLVYTLQANHYRGTSRLQLMVKHLDFEGTRPDTASDHRRRQAVQSASR